MTASVGIYALFALLYIIYRNPDPDNSNDSDEDEGIDDLEKDIEEKSRELASSKRMKKSRDKIKVLGTSMRRILVHHLQILSSIFGVIAWSPDLPRWIVNGLQAVASLFTIDFSSLFSSPECAAETSPREKWLFRLMVAIVLVLQWQGTVDSRK